MQFSKYVRLLPGLVILVLISGCRPSYTLSEESIDPIAGEIIAKADSNVVLSVDDFFWRLSGSRLLMNGGVLDEAETKYRLDSILLDTLAGLAANDVRLSEHFTVYSTYRLQYYDMVASRYWDETLYKLTKADSLEAIEFHQEHPELFSVEEQVDLYHFLVSPFGLTIGPDSTYYKAIPRNELWEVSSELAYYYKMMLDWGIPFQNVAYGFSHDVSSRDNGGHVGWTTRGVYLDPFDSVAFSLDIGSHSDPYRDRDGWHLIYVDGYVPDGPVSIDSPGVYSSAMQTLLTYKSNQALETRLDSLHGEIQVKPNPLIMNDTVNLHLVEDSIWAGIVNDQDTIFCRELKWLEEPFRKKYEVKNTTPDIKLEMLEQASARYVQVQAARIVGIDTLPDVLEGEQILRHLKQKSIVQRASYSSDWEPEISAIDSYYDQHIDDYVFGKPLKALAMVTADSSFAEFIREQAASGQDFNDIAREHGGTDEHAITVKELGYFGPGELHRNLYRIVLATPVGSISRLARDESGNFWVFKLLEHRQSRTVELVRGEIRSLMQKEHARQVWQQYRDEMYRKYHVKFNRRVSEIRLGNYHVRNGTKDN